MLLESAVLCLALNIFHEARGESVIGQYAVAQVTMNRAQGDQRKVCKEVYRPSQFSWVGKKPAGAPTTEPDRWEMAKKIARVQLSGRMRLDFSKGATHYHAVHVRPHWALKLDRTVRIGRHVFYA